MSRGTDRHTLAAIDALLDHVDERPARRIAVATFPPATLRLFERRVLERLIVRLLGQRVSMTAIVGRLMVRGLSRSSAYAYVREAQALRRPEAPRSPGQQTGTMTHRCTPTGTTP